MSGSTTPEDPHGLERFVTAQAGVMNAVRRELAEGRKTSHWMWFVFPQVEGLGHSPMARRYAVRSGDEARAYLAHPELGPRLVETTELVLAHRGQSADAIFGHTDAMKFRSSMTLFEAFTEAPCFGDALRAFYRGERDPKTVEWLEVHGD